MSIKQFSEFESLIDQWLLTPDPDIEAVVRRHRVLPISADMGGTYYFRIADRKVLCCGWGPGDTLYVEVSAMGMYALVMGSKKYPQLRAFLPNRPSDAADCLECRGEGMVMKAIGCGACWSLGWLHALVKHDA